MRVGRPIRTSRRRARARRREVGPGNSGGGACAARAPRPRPPGGFPAVKTAAGARRAGCGAPSSLYPASERGKGEVRFCCKSPGRCAPPCGGTAARRARGTQGCSAGWTGRPVPAPHARLCGGRRGPSRLAPTAEGSRGSGRRRASGSRFRGAAGLSRSCFLQVLTATTAVPVQASRRLRLHFPSWHQLVSGWRPLVGSRGVRAPAAGG